MEMVGAPKYQLEKADLEAADVDAEMEAEQE